MSTRTGSVTLLGFPHTGKSTYLGALWQFIQDNPSGAVREVDTTGDRAYLQQLGETVAQFKTVTRTELDSRGEMRLRVSFGGQEAVDLFIPDVAGEALRVLIEDRAWPEALLANVQSADAFVVFVHPHEITNPERSSLTRSLSTGPEPPRHTEAPVPDTGFTEFESRDACTAAALIDVLENVVAACAAREVRVALVISAWDLVDGGLTPYQWATRDLPAVVSHLKNQDSVDFEVFGVSAQGGDLPGQLEDLLARGSVLERSYAVNSHGDRVELSAPISWAVMA